MRLFFQTLIAESRRESYRMRTYWVEFVAAELFLILGFLLLSGLFEIVAEGQYSDQARMISLLGFLTWQVADGCMVRMAASFAEDAQWGTLEQVWMSRVSPTWIFVARSVVVFVFNGLKALLTAVVVLTIFRTPLRVTGAMGVVFLLSQAGVFGVAFIIVGLHLIFKSVESVTLVLSTLLLFVTGALTPLDSAPILASIGRLLPLGQGVAMLQAMLVTPVSLHELLGQARFAWLLVHTGVYMVAGWTVFAWSQRAARQRGSLGHY